MLISITVNRSGIVLIKENKDTYLDFNAIAKGYAVDVIADFLEEKGISKLFG